MAAGTMPWQVESSKGNNADEHFKYQYHPGGDKSKAPKDAPSALHSVIVPNVNLPKVCSYYCVQFATFLRSWLNYRDSHCMINTTNGERMVIESEQ